MSKDARWGAVLVGIVLLGVGLRAAQYLSRQSYWNDEAALLLNIFDKPAGELMGKLDHEQAAPPLFLLALRGMYLLFGRHEHAMRLVPLLLSIGALVIFSRIVVKLLPPAVAAITLALFAISEHLITHAAEAKQYSGDTLVAALLILLAAAGAGRVPASARLLRVSLAATVAMWLSHPTVFVFGGIALALVLPELLRGNWRSVAIGSMAGLLPVASFVVLYLVSVRHQQSDALFNYWNEHGHFVDYARPWLIPWWLIRHTLGTFDYPYDGGGAVLLPLAILGGARLWRDGRRELLGICTFPILLTLLAGLAYRYPYGGSRVTLFLAPPCLLLAGFGMSVAAEVLRPRIGRLAWGALVAALIALNGVWAAYHLVVPRYRGNMRPVIAHIRAHRQPDEPVFALRHTEFLAYWPDPDENVSIGHWPRRFPRQGRFWVALSVGQGENKLERELRYDQRELGQPTAITRWRGGAALFYDRAAQPAGPNS